MFGQKKRKEKEKIVHPSNKTSIGLFGKNQFSSSHHVINAKWLKALLNLLINWFFQGFTAVSQQQRESKNQITRLEEHQKISLILVEEKNALLNYLRSGQPLIQGERCESHTKHIYSAWNASKTNIAHLLNRRCQQWRGGVQKTPLSVKNYREISHNVTTHTHGKEATSRCRSPDSCFKKFSWNQPGFHPFASSRWPN